MCLQRILFYWLLELAQWTQIMINIKTQERTDVHLLSLEKYNNHKNEKKNISYVIEQNKLLAARFKEEKINKNRLILSRIIEVILLCARNNIAFRGSDDRDRRLFYIFKCIKNKIINFRLNFSNIGCFKEIINHQAKFDTVLCEHLKTNKKCLYLHGSIINEILEIISDQIVKQIIKSQKQAKSITALV